MYKQTENEVSRSRLSEVRAPTRQTDTHTPSSPMTKRINTPH